MEIEKIDKLNAEEKLFLAYKIIKLWSSNKIYNETLIFTPESLDIKNSEDIKKVLLFCSNNNEGDFVIDLFNRFNGLKFYEKLDFMIYLFDSINDLEIIPNMITDNISFKDLSNEILKYKLELV